MTKPKTFNFRTKTAAFDAAKALSEVTGTEWRGEKNTDPDKAKTYPFVATCEPRPTKTVTNLMSGKPVVIDADTPLCCDPSSETYWSM